MPAGHPPQHALQHQLLHFHWFGRVDRPHARAPQESAPPHRHSACACQRLLILFFLGYCCALLLCLPHSPSGVLGLGRETHKPKTTCAIRVMCASTTLHELQHFPWAVNQVLGCVPIVTAWGCRCPRGSCYESQRDRTFCRVSLNKWGVQSATSWRDQTPFLRRKGFEKVTAMIMLGQILYSFYTHILNEMI